MKYALVALACTAVLAGAARAEPPRGDHYEMGKRLFAAKRYAEALEEFRRALAVAPRPEVLYSMAQAQRMLGDCPGAVETYRAFLAGQPGEPLAEYARANIERCEAARQGPQRSSPVGSSPVGSSPVSSSPAGGSPVGGSPAPTAPGRAWYRDGVGDVLVGTGVVAGVVGAVIWRSGRSTASAVAGAPDYQDFVQRRSAAGSALAEQEIGIAVMLAGGAAIVGGVIHYLHDAGPSSHELALGVAPTAGGAVLSGLGTF
jgi:tetratricopeptide (TPR) repeat protein